MDLRHKIVYGILYKYRQPLYSKIKKDEYKRLTEFLASS